MLDQFNRFTILKLSFSESMLGHQSGNAGKHGAILQSKGQNTPLLIPKDKHEYSSVNMCFIHLHFTSLDVPLKHFTCEVALDDWPHKISCSRFEIINEMPGLPNSSSTAPSSAQALFNPRHCFLTISLTKASIIYGSL